MAIESTQIALSAHGRRSRAVAVPALSQRRARARADRRRLGCRAHDRGGRASGADVLPRRVHLHGARALDRFAAGGRSIRGRSPTSRRCSSRCSPRRSGRSHRRRLAYHLVQAENALFMSLAAVPVYLLARRVGLGTALLARLRGVRRCSPRPRLLALARSPIRSPTRSCSPRSTSPWSHSQRPTRARAARLLRTRGPGDVRARPVRRAVRRLLRRAARDAAARCVANAPAAACRAARRRTLWASHSARAASSATTAAWSISTPATARCTGSAPTCSCSRSRAASCSCRARSSGSRPPAAATRSPSRLLVVLYAAARAARGRRSTPPTAPDRFKERYLFVAPAAGPDRLRPLPEERSAVAPRPLPRVAGAPAARRGARARSRGTPSGHRLDRLAAPLGVVRAPVDRRPRVGVAPRRRLRCRRPCCSRSDSSRSACGRASPSPSSLVFLGAGVAGRDRVRTWICRRASAIGIAAGERDLGRRRARRRRPAIADRPRAATDSSPSSSSGTARSRTSCCSAARSGPTCSSHRPSAVAPDGTLQTPTGPLSDAGAVRAVRA